ncbi:SIR2 family protein [Ketobacter alkanivorans]|uniref:SIR2 family protein n=2 Tax=Ketobacter alkanivorans TaxID=1917421 RepID=A0A2K9LLI6_9GAMM|nr:SIR2 family protein [Ketobacter alkanivorans]
MALMSIEKQAQDYYARAPLIVLGSGASAAYGMSGMGKLANYLIEHTDVSDLPEKDQSNWVSFCEALNSGVGLETALHQVQVSEALTGKIINHTWTLINREDLEIFKRSLEGNDRYSLGILLSHMFRSSISTINIITTNYDRLAEYACDKENIHHYTGFTHGYFRQLSQPSEVKVSRKANIWKVHGSLDWFESPLKDVIGLSHLEEIPAGYLPQIVTPGTQKYQRTHLEPYRSIINNADLAITNAASYLCVGYGFNDEHIQPKLMRKCARQGAPITIVTYALSEATKKHVINGGVNNYLAIERGAHDDQSVIYSSLEKEPVVVEKNLWSLQGYLTLIM